MPAIEIKDIDLINAVVLPIFLTVTFGGWLALITANIVYLRDAKSRATTLLFDLQTHVRTISAEPTVRYDLAIHYCFKEFDFLTVDLQRRGYRHLADAIFKCRTRICHSLLEAAFNIRLQYGPDPEELPGEPELYKYWNDRMCQEFISVALQVLAKQMDVSANSIIRAPTDWDAILEIPTIVRFLEQHGQSRRSDDGGRAQI